MAGRADRKGRVRLEYLEGRALFSGGALTAIACLPVVDPEPVAAADSVAAAPPFPIDQTFLLHSHASASKVIYLDFDGQTTSGTSWNTTYNGGQDFYTPPFSYEGDYRDDYFAIDSNFRAGNSGYSIGDFDYSGRIDGDDYFIIDSHFAAPAGGGPPGSTFLASGASQAMEIQPGRRESAYDRLIEPAQVEQLPVAQS